MTNDRDVKLETDTGDLIYHTTDERVSWETRTVPESIAREYGAEECEVCAEGGDGP